MSKRRQYEVKLNLFLFDEVKSKNIHMKDSGMIRSTHSFRPQPTILGLLIKSNNYFETITEEI